MFPMSSTSLNSYDTSECCQCMFQDSSGRIYHPGPPTPFYSTMGRPLVYYAQLQPHDGRPKREGNKNCFVKAFKWYTQSRPSAIRKATDVCARLRDILSRCKTEHRLYIPVHEDLDEMRKPDKRVPSDLTGFANWLDSKYCEYLSESEAQRIAQQSHRVSTLDTTSCPPCPPGTTRRFPRMRSPWSKRKSASKNAGDNSCKSKSPTPSCQFILHPQELTRPASACYQTPPTCPNKSNAMMISNDAIGTKKSVVKSRSMTSISHENVTRNCIDMITVQEGPTNVPIASCDQNRKVDKKNLPQIKQEFRTVEETRQKFVNSPRLQVPCIEPYQVVQQFCDQNCRTKQNFQNVEKIQRVPSKSQIIETRSNETCTSNQEYKLGQEVSRTLYEKNCSNKKEIRSYVQEVKSHARDTLCGQDCTTKENCNFLQEVRGLPVKSCKLETYEQNSKGVRECNLVRKARDDQGIFRIQKCPNEQECAIELETERISSTYQLINTNCDRDALTKEKYVGRIEPAKSEKAELLCDLNCPAKQKNNVDERCPTQTQGTVLPGEQIYETYKQRLANMPKTTKLSKILKVDNECQCPEEKPEDKEVRPRLTSSVTESTDLTCNCIVLQRIPPVHVQAQQNQRTAQQYTQSKTKPPVSYFSKKTQKSKVDVSCQCPEEDTMQYTVYAPSPLYISPQATNKSYVSYYPKKLKSIKVDVSCQCSENDMKQNDFLRVSDRRPQVKTKPFNWYAQKKTRGKMINVSCECSEEDVLQYDTSCQYRRNDFESSANITCFCPKSVRSTTPVCNIQRSDSYTVKNLVQLRKVTHSVAAFRSDSVQTSDHSICFEKSDVHDYALFMKIVCADKLNDNLNG